MAGFSDTIKLTVDVIAGQTQGFKGFLSGMKTDLGEAEGAFGKLKVAGSGAMDFISQNAGALALGAGAAIGGFAIKAVGDFQDIALEAGHLRDALGLSAEDASRWIEVAGDLGISTSTLETAIGKMLKTAGSSPGTFAKLGVEIAHAKDGSVDANGTFLNTIDRLNEMKNPAERAAAAQQLLGKSWRDAAELIGLGADGVKAKLAEVSDAKIIGDSQVEDAKDLRDSLDDLKDSGEDLTLTLGRTLLPMLANIADAAGKIAGPVADLIAQAGDIADTGDEAGASFWDQFKGGIARSVPLFSGNGAWDLLGLGKEDIDASVGQLPTALNEAKIAAAGVEVQAGQTGAAVQLMGQEGAVASSEFAQGMHELAVKTEEYTTAAEEAQRIVNSSDWGEAALAGALQGQQDYSSQFFALRDIASESEAAIDAFGESIKNSKDKVDASTLTLDLNTEAGRNQTEALKGISQTLDTQFAAAFEDAHGNLDTFRGKAEGISNNTLSRLQSEFGLTDDQVNMLRESLGLTAKDWEARFAMSGTEEAREKVGLLQGSIQSITDKDWQAKIATLIAKGDYVGVLAEIQSYYNLHQPTVRVNTVVGTITQVAKNIFGGAIGGTVPSHSTGGTVIRGAEYGPEVATGPDGAMFVLRPGTKVTPRAESANILARTAAMPSIVINNNGRDLTDGDIARAIRKVQLAS